MATRIFLVGAARREHESRGSGPVGRNPSRREESREEGQLVDELVGVCLQQPRKAQLREARLDQRFSQPALGSVEVPEMG